MFNGDKIKRLEDKIYGFKTYRSGPPRPDLRGGSSFTVEGQPGLIKENEKLKAIVAELCDHVYGTITPLIETNAEVTCKHTIEILKLSNPILNGRINEET